MRTDLLRRIEKLEASNLMATERWQVAVRFVGARDGKPIDEIAGRAWRDDAGTIIRSANEAAEAFEARAFDHFARINAAPWPLIVLFD